MLSLVIVPNFVKGRESGRARDQDGQLRTNFELGCWQGRDCGRGSACTDSDAEFDQECEK